MCSKYPNAQFIAHPECKLDVLMKASYVGSTKQLIEYVSNSDCNEFIIGTEMGVIFEMQKRNPDKKFIPLSETLKCYDMKLTKLTDLYNCLRDESNEIILDAEIAKREVERLTRELQNAQAKLG